MNKLSKTAIDFTNEAHGEKSECYLSEFSAFAESMSKNSINDDFDLEGSIGFCFIYLASLASSKGINLEDAVNKAISENN